MTLWRDEDPEVFAATIPAAAEQLGVQPLAVEKDYWVCEVLRAIASAHHGQVVFEGGTSLEKLRIVSRFSETTCWPSAPAVSSTDSSPLIEKPP